MTRPLAVVDPADRGAVFRALRAALEGDGPAVLPAAWSSFQCDSVPQRVAVVIETSGSTGTPKRVALSADALLASAAASASAVGGSGQWLLCLPAHYVAGVNVLVRSIAAETEPVLLPPGRFDAHEFAQSAAMMAGDARYVSVVPVQLARLVDAAEHDASVRRVMRRFDAVLVGGQALRPALRERALDLGVRVVRTYGASETSGGCVYDGEPLAGVRARAVDGILELSGPMLAEGYIGDDARTADAFHDADDRRWYRTGDLGEVDADGRVTVLGRSDNVIISGGEKVLLDAVERRVRELPGLPAAVVVAVEDATWGHVPVVVAPVGSPLPELTEIRSHVAAALGRAAAPARILVTDELPRLASGKPDRAAVARLAAEETRR